MTVTSLKTHREGNPSTPLDDPARDALRAAQSARRAADDAVANQRAAIERARALATAAETDLESAHAGLVNAREADAREAAQAIAAATGVRSGGATRAARFVQTDKEDALNIARDALAKLEADLAELETAALWAHNAVIAARARVLAPRARALLEHAHALRVELMSLQWLDVFCEDDDAPDFVETLAVLRAREQRWAPLMNIRLGIRNFLTGTDLTDEAASRIAQVEHATRWRAAILALLSDAGAELPT